MKTIRQSLPFLVAFPIPVCLYPVIPVRRVSSGYRDSEEWIEPLVKGNAAAICRLYFSARDYVFEIDIAIGAYTFSTILEGFAEWSLFLAPLGNENGGPNEWAAVIRLSRVLCLKCLCS